MTERYAASSVAYKCVACDVAGLCQLLYEHTAYGRYVTVEHARTTYSTARIGSWIGGDMSANCCVKTHHAFCYAWFKLPPCS